MITPKALRDIIHHSSNASYKKQLAFSTALSAKLTELDGSDEDNAKLTSEMVTVVADEVLA